MPMVTKKCGDLQITLPSIRQLFPDILDKRGSRICGNHLSALRDQRCTRRDDNRQNNIYTALDVCASPHIGRSPDWAPTSLPSFPSAHAKSRHDDNDNFSRARSSSLHTRPIHKFQEQYSKHTLMTRHRGDVTSKSSSSVGDIYQPIISRSAYPDLGKHPPLHGPQGISQPIVPSRPFNIYRLNNETSSLEHLVSTTGPARLQDAQVLPNPTHALHTQSVQYQEDNIEGSIRSISPTPATSSMLWHATSEINDSNDKKRKHKCTTCGRSWTRPSSLAIHQVKHTGLKAYQCPKCDQRFGVKSNYVRHLRRKHRVEFNAFFDAPRAGDSEEEPRVCERDEGESGMRFIDEGPRFGQDSSCS